MFPTCHHLLVLFGILKFAAPDFLCIQQMLVGTHLVTLLSTSQKRKLHLRATVFFPLDVVECLKERPNKIGPHYNASVIFQMTQQYIVPMNIPRAMLGSQ